MRKHRFALITAVLTAFVVFSAFAFQSHGPTQEKTSWKSSQSLSVTSSTPTAFEAKLKNFAIAYDQYLLGQYVAGYEAQQLTAYAGAVERAQSTPTVQYTATTSPSTDIGSLPPVFACIIQAESGGDPTVYNHSGSGAAGLFQFMPGTWAGFDGYPSAADAPASVQIQKAEQVYAADGLSPWTGDPCVG